MEASEHLCQSQPSHQVVFGRWCGYQCPELFGCACLEGLNPCKVLAEVVGKGFPNFIKLFQQMASGDNLLRRRQNAVLLIGPLHEHLQQTPSCAGTRQGHDGVGQIELARRTETIHKVVHRGCKARTIPIQKYTIDAHSISFRSPIVRQGLVRSRLTHTTVHIQASSSLRSSWSRSSFKLPFSFPSRLRTFQNAHPLTGFPVTAAAAAVGLSCGF